MDLIVRHCFFHVEKWISVNEVSRLLCKTKKRFNFWSTFCDERKFCQFKQCLLNISKNRCLSFIFRVWLFMSLQNLRLRWENVSGPETKVHVLCENKSRYFLYICLVYTTLYQAKWNSPKNKLNFLETWFI